MPDYGHELEFGIFPTPDADRLDDVFELVQLAEVLGLDIASFQDHPYQARFVDTWTLLSLLGARTTTIKLAPNVTSLPLRPPVVLAKSAATLDRATGGRVELGLGTGAFWKAIQAAGGPERSPRQAVDALIEAIGVIREFFAGGTLRSDGTYYSAKGLHAGPVPAHDIPIWVGAYGPRMLKVTGRLADAWVPSMGYADPPALGDLSRKLDAAAVAAGRGPEPIRRIYNIVGNFSSGGGFLSGGPAEWAEQLAGLAVEHGISTFILGSDDVNTVRRYAEEVVPAVKDHVATERARPASDGADAGPAAHARTASEHAESTSGSVRRTPVAAGVTPTPDTGERLATSMPWDDTSRPSMGESIDSPYTPEQLAVPQHLIDVHDNLRSELNQVRDIVSQVRSGHATVGAARSVINSMTMRQNNWTLGAYCQSYFRFVAEHHTLEDRAIFPHLRRSESGVSDVLDRLEDEHHVIAEVLEKLDDALVAIVGTESSGAAGTRTLEDLQHEVDVLTDTMLSHLSYEERELFGPLARHGFN